MKRYRLVITKFIYPPIFIICFVNGLKLCQILLQESTSLLERKGEDQFLNFLLFHVQFVHSVFIWVIFYLFSNFIHSIAKTTNHEKIQNKFKNSFRV